MDARLSDSDALLSAEKTANAECVRLSLSKAVLLDGVEGARSRPFGVWSLGLLRICITALEASVFLGLQYWSPALELFWRHLEQRLYFVPRSPLAFDEFLERFHFLLRD